MSFKEYLKEILGNPEIQEIGDDPGESIYITAKSEEEYDGDVIVQFTYFPGEKGIMSKYRQGSTPDVPEEIEIIKVTDLDGNILEVSYEQEKEIYKQIFKIVEKRSRGW